MIDLNDIDLYAAEYVLGTLNHAERAEVESLRVSDLALDAAITAWEMRLAPLNEITPDVAPSADLYLKIEKRILELKPLPSHRPDLVGRSSRWQGMALAASLAFLMVSGLVMTQLPWKDSQRSFVAVLQKDSATPLFVARFRDDKTLVLDVKTLAPVPPADKSYELWLIVEGEKTPRPLGVLQGVQDKQLALSGIDPSLVRGATLAVSVEPLGGSPTGLPTGPVIVTGKIVQDVL